MTLALESEQTLDEGWRHNSNALAVAKQRIEIETGSGCFYRRRGLRCSRVYTLLEGPSCDINSLRAAGQGPSKFSYFHFCVLLNGMVESSLLFEYEFLTLNIGGVISFNL